MGSRKRRGRRHLDAPEPLEEVLGRAGENRFAKRQLPISLARWRQAVGPRIADRARPIALERGILIVKVATSVWANELAMLAPQIIGKLEDLALGIKSLRFRVGPLDVEEGIKEQRVYREVPPPVDLPPQLATSLEKVEDDELRGLIARTAAQNLAWQRAPGLADAVSAKPRAAPGPRDAGRGNAPPDRSAGDSGAASRRNSGVDSSRRR